jgi:hypothetical protein
MENKPEIIPEQNIPEEAPALADWIEAELGDDELAQFLREHPEGIELLSNGERILPRTVFDVADDLKQHNPEQVPLLLEQLTRDGYLPESSIRDIDTSDEDLPDYVKTHALLLHRAHIGKETIRLHVNERERTEGETVMWERALHEVNVLRESYGITPINPSPDTLHIIEHFFKRTSMGKGALELPSEQIHVAMETNDASRMKIIFHELTHLASRLSLILSVDESRTIKTTVQRLGLARIRKQTPASTRGVFFHGLNEAVTEETAKHFIQSLSADDPQLSDLVQERRERIEQFAREHENQRSPQRTDDIIDVHTAPDGKTELEYFTYAPERNVMFDMFKKIYERNPARFEEKTQEEASEELFAMLQKAMFTGNILPFGRLFNDTFGHGKFREFGHLQTTEEQQAFVEGL